ncbi:DUF1523 family protein [Marivivens donghaensis]|uniref:DUF1523 family protein n=1 Tax=Marivivens donghaensis TaxID=1699413 RepID=A0ABX0VWK6_9RHOB|nr:MULTISPECIES: DUF1523 family protein [Marivivens]NIY70993.1 DUF1523 family protein [Marivivens donghaensis]
MSFRMIFRAVLVVLLLPFFDYVLPQHDIARITGTEVIRQDFSRWNRMFYAQPESGNADLGSRDVLFINTVRRPTYLFGLIRGSEANDIMIYRNEDTGWIWPPYFKFDSRDLQGEAQEYTSTSANPQWVVITKYGWRNRFLTTFPNAVRIKPVDGPDVTIIPWFNIIFFIALAIFILFTRRVWFQFRERVMDPALGRAGNGVDRMEAGIAERKSRFNRWRNRK